MMIGLISIAKLAALLAGAGPALALLAAPNEDGVSMGHVHLIVSDMEAGKKFWVTLGRRAGQLWAVRHDQISWRAGAAAAGRTQRARRGIGGRSCVLSGAEPGQGAGGLASRRAEDGAGPHRGAGLRHHARRSAARRDHRGARAFRSDRVSPRAFFCGRGRARRGQLPSPKCRPGMPRHSAPSLESACTSTPPTCRERT